MGMNNFISYFVSVVLTVVASSFLGLTLKQIMVVAGFSSILFGAIFFWRYRLAFAFFGVGALLTMGLIDVPHVIEFAGVDIILFLIGMMIVVGFLEENEFFEHLVDRLIVLVDMNGRMLLIVILVASFVFAALVDEVTSVLFMISAMLNIVSRYKLNPIPFIMMVVFTTNIGSSATVVGNPVGVMIALRSGLGFLDFLRWATPISIIALLVTIPICFLYFSKAINQLHQAMRSTKSVKVIKEILAEDTSTRKGILVSAILFSGVVLGLIFHSQIEHLFGLTKNTMLLGVALIGAAAALLLSRGNARALVEKRVDWWTLCFFLFLFASVGALKYQGITEVIARRILEVSANNLPVLMALCMWISGAMTAVMDNVLAVATFIPIIKDMGDMGVPIFPLWWSVLFGSTLLGNLTIIGSTANIVAVGMLERRKLGAIGFLEWLKAGVLVAIPTLLIAHLLLFLQLKWMIR